VTATDLVLAVTEMLRAEGVVEKFVEFFGPGIKNLTVTDRATISNMTPEYGATLGYFPIDDKTIAYLHTTNRSQRAERVEACAKALGLFYTGAETPDYTKVLEIDLAGVQPAVAGPARPQDRILLGDLKAAFSAVLGCRYDRDTDIADISTFHNESGSQTARQDACEPGAKKRFDVGLNRNHYRIGDGSIVIAAITSCTNTSNPSVMLGPAWWPRRPWSAVSACRLTSKPPWRRGPRWWSAIWRTPALSPYLDALGFHLAGFGCTTCIGNSGPLHPAIEKIIAENDLTWRPCSRATAISRPASTRASRPTSWPRPCWWWPSPWPAGSTSTSPRSRFPSTPTARRSTSGIIWPSAEEIAALTHKHVKQAFYAEEYGRIFEGDEFWQAMPVTESTTFDWEAGIHLHQKPPVLSGVRPEPQKARRDQAGPGAAGFRRQRHHRPYLAGRGDSRGLPGRPLSARQGRGRRRFQLLRLAPGKPRGHDARDVRQHPDQKQAGGPQGGQLHP
jgi:aconitate hydratase